MNGTRLRKSKELEPDQKNDAPHESEVALLEEPALRVKKNQILSSRLVAQNTDTRQTRGSDAGKLQMTAAAKITFVDRKTHSNVINADESIAIENEADVGMSTNETASGGKGLPLTDSQSRGNLVSFQTVRVSGKEKQEGPSQPNTTNPDQKESLYKTDRPKLSLTEVPSIQVSKPAADEKQEQRGKFEAFASEQLSILPKQQEKRFVKYMQPKTLHLPLSPTVKVLPPARLDSENPQNETDNNAPSLENGQPGKLGSQDKIVMSQEELQTPLQQKSHRSNSRRESYETVLTPLSGKMKIKAPSQSGARDPVAQKYQKVAVQSRRLEEGSAPSKESLADADRSKPGLASTFAVKKSDEPASASKKGILRNKKSAECIDDDSESGSQDAQNGHLTPSSSNAQSAEERRRKEVRFNLIPTVQYVSFYIRKHGLHHSYRDDCCCSCSLI
jgi:hypothetical protein